MKTKLILTILTFSVNVYSQDMILDSIKFSQLSQKIVNQVFESSMDRRDINKKILKAFEKIDRQRFKVASKNEKYESTDIIQNKKLPNKRLIYLAYNKHFVIVTYEQGGFAKKNYSRIIEQNDCIIKCVFTFMVPYHEKFEELKELLNHYDLLKFNMQKSLCF